MDKVWFIKRRDNLYPEMNDIYVAKTALEALMQHYNKYKMPVYIEHGIIYWDLLDVKIGEVDKLWDITEVNYDDWGVGRNPVLN